jgi:hypothetical protein
VLLSTNEHGRKVFAACDDPKVTPPPVAGSWAEPASGS